MKQSDKPKDPTEADKQRAVLRELLVCKVCGGARKYDERIGFTCANWMHEWQSETRSQAARPLGQRLGAGKKRRL